MNTKQLSRTAALAAIVIAAGCGGGGSKVHLNQSNIEFIGTNPIQATLSAPATVPATGGTEVTTSYGTAVIPSGSVTGAGGVVDATTPLIIIPAGTGITGTFPANAQVTVNGVANSGAIIGSDGKLDFNIAIPVPSGDAGASYTITFPATVLPTRVLTVGSIDFSGKFYFRVVGGVPQLYSPVPKTISGALPSDGQNAAGSYMIVQWAPNNAGRTATLVVDYGTGFTLHQTQTIDARGSATFRDLFKDSQNVPNTGVQTVSFTVSDL